MRRNTTSLFFCLILASLLVAAHDAQGQERVPQWKAGVVVVDSELIAILDGPSREEVYPWVSLPEVFGRDERAPLYTFTVVDAVLGDIEDGRKIVVVAPPGLREHRSAGLTFGRSMLFLQRVAPEHVERIRGRLEWGAEDFPAEVWTFVEHDYGWMSWIQFKSGAEREARISSPIVSQLAQFADVDRKEEDVVEYIRGLVELRRGVLELGRDLEPNDLDRFQKEVVRHAALRRTEAEKGLHDE